MLWSFVMANKFLEKQLFPFPDFNSENNLILTNDKKFLGFTISSLIDQLESEFTRLSLILEPQNRKLTELRNLIDSAKDYTKINHVDLIASTFYFLGRVAKDLETGFYEEKAQELLQAQAESLKGKINIHILNAPKQSTIGMARELAAEKWSNDPNIRVGEMADLLYSKLYTFFQSKDSQEGTELLNTLPDKPSQIKNWIREIAPPEAQRRGRPPKN